MRRGDNISHRETFVDSLRGGKLVKGSSDREEWITSI